MHFSVDDRVFVTFPDLQIGILACHDIRNSVSPLEVTAVLRAAEAELRSHETDPEHLKEYSTIKAWQEAHRAFGSNPNKFMCSVHALAKRVVKGNNLPNINILVDCYNSVSLKTLLPIGGEDLDCCSGNIHLTIAEGYESFTPLGEDASDPPEAGEVIYRDDVGVICRKFNWREAARTCLTQSTTNAVLVIEALPPTTSGELSQALSMLAEMVQRYCGGLLKGSIIHSSNRIIDL
jgi:DNA/RNA-binding domain of Phe-tRNA-synthetase-like protein